MNALQSTIGVAVSIAPTPTVGRKLWYWPTSLECREKCMARIDEATPFDASVTYVHADKRTVNLAIYDHRGYLHRAEAVPLRSDIAPDNGYDAPRGCATWMPYQVQQHAKGATS